MHRWEIQPWSSYFRLNKIYTPNFFIISCVTNRYFYHFLTCFFIAQEAMIHQLGFQTFFDSSFSSTSARNFLDSFRAYFQCFRHMMLGDVGNCHQHRDTLVCLEQIRFGHNNVFCSVNIHESWYTYFIFMIYVYYSDPEAYQWEGQR